MKEKPELTDPDVYPDDKVLAGHLGTAKKAWDDLVSIVEKNETVFLHEWTYYRDGHNWLTRVMKKKKTVCWISVWEKYFKVAFYVKEADKELKEASSAIDVRIKKQWQPDNQGKKSRSIVIAARKKSDIKLISKMIDVKVKFL